MDLEDEVDLLRKENKSLQRRLDRILTENERLRKEQEEALRSLMRLAAPFSKGSAKIDKAFSFYFSSSIHPPFKTRSVV
jgi:predicted  nucleic acid-binding Zn-ribbon protein